MEGETYTNPKLQKDVMVLGISAEDAATTTLAILWVDRTSKETTGGDQLVVNKIDYADWSEVDL